MYNTSIINTFSITKHEVLDLRSRMDSESKKVVESLQKAEMDKQKEKSRFLTSIF